MNIRSIFEVICSGFITVKEFIFKVLRRLFGVESKEYTKRLAQYEKELSDMFEYLVVEDVSDHNKLEEVKKYCLMKLKNTDTEDNYRKYIQEELDKMKDMSLYEATFKYNCLEDDNDGLA